MRLTWPANPLVYEVNIRVLLRELSARSGHPATLADVPDSVLARWADLGFDGLWLMGIWTTGPDGLARARRPALRAEYGRVLTDLRETDIIGSPYAVARYAVSPDLGGPEALAALRKRMARHGLRLLLDFVGNHTACDHHLLEEAPEVFMPGREFELMTAVPGAFRTPSGRLVAHGRDPNYPAWTDTAQVNYGHPVAHTVMREQLLEIARQCDGVRCDMAMLMLPDVIGRTWGDRLPADCVRESFWQSAIHAVKLQHRHFLFLAEAYWDLEPRLQHEGFDYTYDKALYDRLLAADATGARAQLRWPKGSAKAQARFLENHDEERAAWAFGARGAAAAAVTYLAPGLRLFHEGQLEGWRIRVPVQLGRRPLEVTLPDVARDYAALLALLREPLLRSGQFELLETRSSGGGDTSHEQMVALAWWGAEPPWCVVVANLSGQRVYARLPLPAPRFAPDMTYVFHDRVTGESYERAGSELVGPGLFVTLDMFGCHLFDVTPV